MFMNADLPWLKLHLPVYLSSGVFDGVVALAGDRYTPLELADMVRGHSLFVGYRAFDWHFGNQANHLVDCCERQGFDALFRADPDELVSGDHLRRMRATLEAHPDKLIGLSRLHFIGDRLHIQPDWRPDFQWRAWTLNRGVRYGDDARVHELPTAGVPNERYELDEAVILHYGYIEPAPVRAYKIAAYEAVQKGLALPKREAYAHWSPLDIPRVPFVGDQPLDPAVIGVHAPFEVKELA